VDGALTAYVERGGRTALTWSTEPTVLDVAMISLAELVRKQAASDITIEKVDGQPILPSAHPLTKSLVNAGFKITPKGYTLRAR
jgi:ATP-dependent Lhr-like helicase